MFRRIGGRGMSLGCRMMLWFMIFLKRRSVVKDVWPVLVGEVIISLKMYSNKFVVLSD